MEDDEHDHDEENPHEAAGESLHRFLRCI